MEFFVETFNTKIDIYKHTSIKKKILNEIDIWISKINRSYQKQIIAQKYWQNNCF